VLARSRRAINRCAWRAGGTKSVRRRAALIGGAPATKSMPGYGACPLIDHDGGAAAATRAYPAE
jgi:hypothetical protein